MAHRLPAISLPGIMNHRNEPVAVMPNVENYISVHRVGIAKYPSHIGKTYPSSQSDDFMPCGNLFCCILIVFCCLIQMP